MSFIIWSLLSFIVAVTVLVAFHEYGHFITARFFGVKVLRYSIGFGPALLKRTAKSGTEYVLASIPIGGYVKLLGETTTDFSNEEADKAFCNKSVWIRMAIVFAGPLFNLILAILIYWFVFMIGINSAIPIIGEVVPNSIASKAGLVANNEIVAINKNATQTWDDIIFAMVAYLGKNSSVSFTTKDLNTQVEATKILNLQDWHVDENKPKLMKSLGIVPYKPKIPSIIAHVLPGGAADSAGIHKGDRIIAVNNIPVTDWDNMRFTFMKFAYQTVVVKIDRNGKIFVTKVTPESSMLDGKKIAIIGVESTIVKYPNDKMRTIQYPVFQALTKAFDKTYRVTALTFLTIYKMIVGQISLASISGPIGIAQGAGMSANVGFSYFLDFMALISISLGIINLLPIPLLDGGHILFFIIEAIRRKPVSDKVKEVAFRLGIIFLFGLIVLAFYNDFHRILS